GEIAKVWGLADVQIGDRIGHAATPEAAHEFPPPTLESVVVPVDPGDGHRLRVALEQLAEQDPLIDVRQDDLRQEISVSLYGEVQKEVIAATLARDYALEVLLREPTPIYVERPRGVGEAVEVMHAPTNPYDATIGFRVERAADGSGIAFSVAVDSQTIPLHLYKTREGFVAHMEDYVRRTLREGLFGWQVIDCAVTMTKCAYGVADGPPSKRGSSTPTSFRKLTPIVLTKALEQARTVVCQPTLRLRIEIPSGTIGAVTAAVARLGAGLETSSLTSEYAVAKTTLPVLRVRELQRQLSHLTGGEGVFESHFEGYEPVNGDQPTRLPSVRAIG
ncbi:MAG TPA: hypothetical protein VFM96_11215, partial [Gaiellaceae bacterium]|nr:hypothetical protein [Gaiellaceae bacterium]